MSPMPPAGLHVVESHLAAAVAAHKCHACGCLRSTVESMAATDAGRAELAPVIAQARAVYAPQAYECLGCAVCFPALAGNAWAEAFPSAGGALALCPTEKPAEQSGWPPLPGAYRVLRYRAPVAVCTLHSQDLFTALERRAPEGLAVVGALSTENLGIERIIRNVLANPHIRFLVVCGEDTQQAVGHLPGQSLHALCAHGVDGDGRIRGASGKRPYLKNVTPAAVEAFRRQIEVVPMIGETDAGRIAQQVTACAARDPGAYAGEGAAPEAIATITAQEPKRLISDPAGYLIVYADHRRHLLVVEHYTTNGVLGCVVEGATATAVCGTIMERGVISRMDHAAYLGRELARAAQSLDTGVPYVQDRAPGDSAVETNRVASRMPLVSCGAGCGCPGEDATPERPV